MDDIAGALIVLAVGNAIIAPLMGYALWMALAAPPKASDQLKADRARLDAEFERLGAYLEKLRADVAAEAAQRRDVEWRP